MLINVRISELHSDTRNSLFLLLLVGVVVYSTLDLTFSNFETSQENVSRLSENLNDEMIRIQVNLSTSDKWDGNIIPVTEISSIGKQIYSSHAMWLMVISVILLLAMIGTIVMTVSPTGFNNSESGLSQVRAYSSNSDNSNQDDEDYEDDEDDEDYEDDEDDEDYEDYEDDEDYRPAYEDYQDHLFNKDYHYHYNIGDKDEDDDENPYLFWYSNPGYNPIEPSGGNSENLDPVKDQSNVKQFIETNKHDAKLTVKDKNKIDLDANDAKASKGIDSEMPDRENSVSGKSHRG